MTFADCLTQAERERYSRHLALPEIGAAGQSRLKSGRVLVVGAGGLGSPVCLYLAAAGVGTLGIIDFDQVETSNLQRQVLFGTEDLGQNKAKQAAKRLRDLNPAIEIQPHCDRLDASNIEKLVAGYDLVIDGTDNQSTRYLLNDACHFYKTPLVYGSIYRFEGQVSVFGFDEGPCYRCLYPNNPDSALAVSCARAGVLGVLPAVIGGIQATEAIKILTGTGQPLSGRLLLYDALAMRFDEISYQKNASCGLCGTSPTIRTLEDSIQDMNQSSKDRGTMGQISACELRGRLDAGEQLQILDVRSVQEREAQRIEASIHIPLGELRERAFELDEDAEIVVHCQAGGRSAKACALLTDLGFSNIRNLTGGLDAWESK